MITQWYEQLNNDFVCLANNEKIFADRVNSTYIHVF